MIFANTVVEKKVKTIFNSLPKKEGEKFVKVLADIYHKKQTSDEVLDEYKVTMSDVKFAEVKVVGIKVEGVPFRFV